MNILSLFDGMSCGRLALDRANIKYGNYYAAEIDKYAVKVSTANYPDTIQLGDVTKWREWDIDWASIDLLLGGSPCQGFSFAGKQLAFDDPRSALFFVYVDILNHIKSVNPKVKFLLENVRMKKEHLAVISDHVGVEPVMINSALLSAQNRVRYYWANWDIKQPEDKGILLKDIIDDAQTERDKAHCLDANYHKGSSWEQYKTKHRRQQVLCGAVNAASVVGRRLNDRGVRDDYNKEVPITQCLQVKHDSSKMHCITTVQKDTVLSELPPGRYTDSNQYGNRYRKLTPIECERLQTVPDDYTNHVSNTQRYKMLGNGWTVEVIAHILKGL